MTNDKILPQKRDPEELLKKNLHTGKAQNKFKIQNLKVKTGVLSFEFIGVY